MSFECIPWYSLKYLGIYSKHFMSWNMSKCCIVISFRLKSWYHVLPLCFLQFLGEPCKYHSNLLIHYIYIYIKVLPCFCCISMVRQWFLTLCHGLWSTFSYHIVDIWSHGIYLEYISKFSLLFCGITMVIQCFLNLFFEVPWCTIK